MVRNIEFTNCQSKFLNELSNEVKNIRNSPNVIVPADKTSNMYEMKKEDYEKLLKDNVTKDYKKAGSSAVKKVNNCAKVIASSLKLESKLSEMERDC